MSGTGSEGRPCRDTEKTCPQAKKRGLGEISPADTLALDFSLRNRDKVCCFSPAWHSVLAADTPRRHTPGSARLGHTAGSAGDGDLLTCRTGF